VLDADIRLRLSRLNLDASLTIAAGEVLALLGPNGSGKSTVLRALTGLQRLDEGRIALDGTVLEDPATRIRVPPEKRPVALMFQDYLLFPHLTALENVAFGPRSQGMDRASARQKAMAALDTLGLTAVAGAKPGAMSGGQQQRVAMARALVTEPRLLLLDEPLAALDVSTKNDLRRYLRPVLRQSSAANILVTHDLLDAVALADRMVVIEQGSIVQTGTPAEVTARPRSEYVADLVGMNLLRGRATGTGLDLDGGGRLVIGEPAAGPVLAVVPPAAVSVSRTRPEPTAGNVWPAQIAGVDLMGDRVRVRLDGAPTLSAEVPPGAVDEFKLDDGGQMWASVEADDIRVYPA
jgi:molybdate transport system ATP-binding protein